MFGAHLILLKLDFGITYRLDQLENEATPQFMPVAITEVSEWPQGDQTDLFHLLHQ